MKKFLITISILISFTLGLTGVSTAKWWIFGQSAKGIRINYLYINKISFDNSVEPRITLFKSSLTSDRLAIKGRATVSGGTIGLVQVTLDGKETWNKVKLSQNGSFEFIFAPEIDHQYDIYIKITDTTGKTNDVDATYKALTVVDKDISSLIGAAVEKLFAAYTEQDPNGFMRLVSPNFEVDEVLLDTAIRKDFTTFDLIQIQHVINTIASGGQNRVYVSLNYNRSVVATNSGEMFTDSGQTEFTFELNQGMPELVRIKNPLLFGLSDASNVSTGSVNQGSNDPILLVDEYGNVTKKPYNEAIDTIESGNTFSSGSTAVTSGSFTVANGANLVETYTFTHDAMMPNELIVPGGTSVKWLGVVDIDTLTTANVSSGDSDMITMAGNESYALLFSDGKYMLMQHVSGAGAGTVMKYRYQPSGSSAF